MIEWKQDEFGKSAVVGGWLALAITESDKGITASINGAVLPIGSRAVETFDSVFEAERGLISATLVCLRSAMDDIYARYAEEMYSRPKEAPVDAARIWKDEA